MTAMDEQQFWHGVNILLSNYHALNKKIFECLITKIEKMKGNQIDDLDDNGICIGDATLSEIQPQLLNADQRAARDCDGYQITLKLLTKKVEDENISGMAIVDFVKSVYLCRFQSNLCDNFVVRLVQGKLVVRVESNRVCVERSERWAEFVLKAKLLKWCLSVPHPDEKQNCSDKKMMTVKSLQLVDKEQYNELYKKLKQKHAQTVLKFWKEARESTDPFKFIYEDLSIATYLILLWRCTKSEPRSFADLGCGNGLLVYILNAEGYAGYGYDIRARKLWSHFPNSILLFEQPVLPDNFQLPADVDWLIGNHSDELSPWIPLLAGIASYDMRYFLLPCCAYEFSGAKYLRRNASISSYQDFLRYTLQISEECGFATKHDRLKIPSTKRLALIGLDRNYRRDEHAARCQALKEFVNAERMRYPVLAANGVDTNMATAVKLREKKQSVRNCTKLDKEVLNSLVLKIFKLLLDSNVQSNDADQNISDENAWKPGGRLTLNQLAGAMSRDDLKHIKSECGGIKTLLRNNHEIFEFCGGTLIGLRRPRSISILTAKRKLAMKKRSCFFHQQHPQGCPLTDSDCMFRH